jgi:hypothetical protein
MGDDVFFCMFVQKANPVLHEIKSWHLADLQRDHPNQKERVESKKICRGGPKRGMENSMFNLREWTYKSYQVQIKVVIGGFSRAQNTILKPQLQKKMRTQ